ncbi:MAG: NmrA family NAD(P)-binding protein [Sandaracinaceae bacterium]|nr:NmrA family NAD(P)-binding protein [Sandaracinaceae bacterium]
MIVVFGCTGSTGPHLCRELLERGERVRVTSRDLTSTHARLGSVGVAPADVEIVSCDLEVEDSIEPALRGAEGVYVAVGGPRGPDDLVATETRLVDLAGRAGVQRFVKVSGIDARPNKASRIERMHGQIAEHLLASELDATVLEPSFFMQNFLGLAPAIRAGALPLPTGDARAALIDARDIASVAAIVLTSDGHRGQRYVLTGPELLSHADVATQMSALLEHPVAFVDVPGEAFEASLREAGLPPAFAALLTDVYVNLYATGRAERSSDEVARLTGKPPRSLATFLRDHRALLG